MVVAEVGRVLTSPGGASWMKELIIDCFDIFVVRVMEDANDPRSSVSTTSYWKSAKVCMPVV